MALDYIGKRGSTVGATRATRIQYARELLQKELLPHIGMEEFCETKKVRAGRCGALFGAGRYTTGGDQWVPAGKLEVRTPTCPECLP